MYENQHITENHTGSHTWESFERGNEHSGSTEAGNFFMDVLELSSEEEFFSVNLVG
jgi:hypothetical protein